MAVIFGKQELEVESKYTPDIISLDVPVLITTFLSTLVYNYVNHITLRMWLFFTRL